MATKASNDIHQMLDSLIRMMLMEISEDPAAITFKEKVSFVSAAGMYLTRDQKLRANDEPGRAGSKVRAYSGAFKTPNAARRRGTDSGASSAAATDADTESDSDD